MCDRGEVLGIKLLIEGKIKWGNVTRGEGVFGVFNKGEISLGKIKREQSNREKEEVFEIDIKKRERDFQKRKIPN